jgi:hypothetical protein
MDAGFGHYKATGIVLVLAGLILRYLQAKAKVVYWVAHDFLFNMPNPTDAKLPNLLLRTHSITVQNIGGKAAELIEIAHTGRPDFFMLSPARDYEEVTTRAGDHIMRVDNLGAGEHFTIEFLTYAQLPTFLYIRSKSGPANLISIYPQRVFPKWFQRLSIVLFLVGAGLITFWLIRLLVFLYLMLFPNGTPPISP